MSKTNSTLSIDGIVLVNKPQGLSSNALLQKIKRLYQARKAGHTGSLDPLATGMLPICFGEATKLSQFLLDADKVYEARGLLGVKTSTADAMGDVINRTDNFHVPQMELQRVIQEFIGPIQQIPSMYSALKHKGTPLYKLAREGITIERKSRDIVIYAIELLNFDGQYFDIRVSCSKGTYIRNLVEDIGEKLGVFAHVTQLHRLHTAGFSNERMYDLDELQAFDHDSLFGCLLPMERAINYIPIVKVTDEEALMLKQGKVITYNEAFSIEGCVRLHDSLNRFIGLGDIQQGNILKVKRLLAI